MATFKVKWEIEVEADDAVAAALEAQQCQLDPSSIANVFDVQDATGTSVQVDLQAQKVEPSTDTQVYTYTQKLERSLDVRLTLDQWHKVNGTHEECDLDDAEAREQVLYPAIQAQYGANWPWQVYFEGEDTTEPKNGDA